jgi:DNA polymerase-3 subunit beta
MPGLEVEQEKPVGTSGATGAMEITVSRADLLRELTATQSVVERKTTIPILSNFLIEAADDKLTITATDLDQSIKTSCAAKVKKPGACTIPARKLYDYIKLLGDGDISIKLMDNHWVQIRSGRSNTKMVGMARANFPQVPAFPEAGLTKLASASLKNMIGKTIFAISNEESRYTLNGALLILKVESLAMVATDGHRLAHVEKSGETLTNISGEKKTLIPRKALSELQSLLSNSDAEQIDFADDDHTLLPHRPSHPHLAQAYRPIPQLRGSPPARQQQIRRRPQRRPDGLNPARRPVRRRTLGRGENAPRAERVEDLLLLH